MMYLKIDDNKGYFLKEDNITFEEIDKIGKEDLLRLIDLAVSIDFPMEEFNEELIKNSAHQIIYKTLYNKFLKLIENKNKFNDESTNLFKDAFQKYSTVEL